jgi:short-subunit dehydrogenase
MTKVLLPKFLEKKGGVIVNLSSSAAELDAPVLSV